MNLTNFTEIIGAGMNDPNCSFYVGAFTGQFIALRYILLLVVIYVIFKAADRLAIDPILNWIKDRLFNKNTSIVQEIKIKRKGRTK